MKRTVDDDTREIIQSFIAEGYERLDDAEAKLQGLGGDGDREILNAVFRLFHSVKGSAGFLEFERIKSLTHEAEALLEVFIKEGIPYTQDSLDVVYDTIDALRELIAAVEADYSDEDCCERATAQTERIRSLVEALRAGKSGAAVLVPAGPAPAAAPAPEAPANVIYLNELVTQDMAERFVAESADLLERVERDALGLESNPESEEAVHSMFRAVHTIKGNAGFFGYGALEARCVEAEQVLDAARKGVTPRNEAFVSGVLARVDGIRSLLSGVSFLVEGKESAAQVPAAPLEAPAASGAPPALAGKPLAAPAAPASDLSYRPLGEILVDMGAAPEEAVRKALEEQEKPVGQLLVESGVVKPADVDKALEVQRKLVSDRPAAEEVQRREIRVDTSKLDKLFDLVGELITAEAMVVNSPDLSGLKLDSFNKSFAALAKISREIQETAMMIRMIPLEGLFHKMSRLVRDLSRKFDKPVDLRIIGEDTEMDKNVIEHVSDPLVHILRNALDHGLETSARRRELGKSEVGSLVLEARYEGSEIWISVKDDGAGLNRERILAKGIEKGLIKGDPSLVPDKDVWALIFEPGFSTAAVVSDVSGRGVGMDVVKRNLEKIRGRVDIRTDAGKGSEFILQIPLTMAIIDGITVRVGRGFYSLPLNDIFEFFKARPDQITKTEGGQETVNLRGSIMPLLKLAEIFKVPDANQDPTEGIMLVVQSAGKRACLLIDEVVGNQQIVIKSLSEYIGKVEGLSGCSILGDGSVSFIIDTGRLIGLRLE
jgi:two-component system chemotaxis sensor kinase CheA